MKSHLYNILITCLITIPAYTQETDIYKNVDRNERYNAGSPIFSPIILPAYTPEMGFILTGGCLVSFKTKRNNDYLHHSNLSFLINKDFSNGIETGINLFSFWLDDRVILDIEVNYKNRIDHYWGVSIDKADDVEKGSNTTQYHLKQKKLTPTLLVKTFGHFYLGLKSDFSFVETSELSDLMLEDGEILKDTLDLNCSGIGAKLLYDTRNNNTNPTKGFLIALEGIYYDKFLSGNYRYQLAGIDYRQYIPLYRKGSIIACQLKSTIGLGDIPWTNLSTVGTPNDLRGFFFGQYRDKSSAWLQFEYRHTFSGTNNNGLSRHGFVFWIGSGTVFTELSGINNALFSTGFGYRYEIQPDNNLRIDLGFGSQNVGIFVSFGEAF